jgi:hypothetical protein
VTGYPVQLGRDDPDEFGPLRHRDAGRLKAELAKKKGGTPTR